jgi:hypothetical protein
MCYCVYRDRAKDESTTFAGMQMVIQQFESRGCAVNLTMRLDIRPVVLNSKVLSSGPVPAFAAAKQLRV